MTTIGDVAKHAGVSAMTVSRVLNNYGYVKEETRERVDKAIAELGFVPNALARSLRFKRTNTLALILTDITNPFFTTIARSVEDAASEKGFNVMFCNTDESQAKETEYLNVLLQKQVDGVLLVPATSNTESISLLQERSVPVVVIDRRIPDMQVDTVRCDSELGAYQLTKYLLDLSHRQIAILGGTETVSTSVDRITGYQRAFAEANLEYSQDMVRYGQFTSQSGYDVTQELLNLERPPTAFVATNNFIAIGAYRALQEAGLQVPHDVSLVAFDDIPAALVFNPFLTVVGQPAHEIGRQATNLLLSRLNGGNTNPPQEIILPLTMTIRQSSGPPKP